MKKIVALVLSLVMVLGLATTAFAATAAKGDVYAATHGTALDYTAEVKAAAPAVESAKMFATYQLFLTNKETKGVTVVGPMAEVAVADQAEWTYVNGTTVRYFAPVTNYGVVVKALEVKAKDSYDCGEFKVAKDTTFYVDAKDKYYVAANGIPTNTDLIGSVDGKVVGLVAVDEPEKQQHSYKYDATDVKGKGYTMTKVYCDDCKATFAFVDGTYEDAVKKFGAGNFTEAFQGIDGMVYIKTGATAGSAAGETVTSPKTFDAGIAMYVGMSVMAAAGSAVVLKKKD